MGRGHGKRERQSWVVGAGRAPQVRAKKGDETGEEKGAGGGEPRQIEAVGPATKQLGPLQLLGPVENISPVQGGLGVSPAKSKEVVGYDADEAD